MNYNSPYLRNRPFLIATPILRVAEGTKTQVAGWNEDRSNIESLEEIQIVDRVSTKMLEEAAVIIDIMNSTMVKCRYADQDGIMERYAQRYSNEIVQAMRAYVAVETSEASE